MVKDSLLKGEFQFLNVDILTITRDLYNNLQVSIMGEETYNDVQLTRTFPYSFKDKYILLRDNQGKEIGIIEDIGDLSIEVQKILRDELEKAYYIPEIKKVISIIDKMRTPVWTVETDKGIITFELARRNDAKFIKINHLVIKDSNGAKYEIPDYTLLDRRSQELIEREV